MNKKYKLIILDRDGVINEDSPFYIKTPTEWHPIKNSLKAIAKINESKIKVVVASNQSGIGRGYFTKETLALIHKKMEDELAKVGGRLDGIYYCPHHPADNCNCRKPKTEMLQTILNDFNIEAQDTLVVGDALRDIQSAIAIGSDAALVKTGKGKKMLQQYTLELKDIPVYDDLYSLIIDVV